MISCRLGSRIMDRIRWDVVAELCYAPVHLLLGDEILLEKIVYVAHLIQLLLLICDRFAAPSLLRQGLCIDCRVVMLTVVVVVVPVTCWANKVRRRLADVGERSLRHGLAGRRFAVMVMVMMVLVIPAEATH